MATLYVSSVDGDNDSPPSVSWWNGNQATYETVAGALVAATDATNIIYVSHVHSFTYTATHTWGSASAVSLTIISVNRPTGVWTQGASELMNASATFSVGSADVEYYIYGFVFDTTGGSGASKYFIMASGNNCRVTLDNCIVSCQSTSAPVTVLIGTIAGTGNTKSFFKMVGGQIVMLNSNSATRVIGIRQCDAEFHNITLTYSGVGRPLSIFGVGGSASSGWRSNVRVLNSDLSGYTSGMLVSPESTNLYFGEIIFLNLN